MSDHNGATREMTLQEWVETLPEYHGAHGELKTLKAKAEADATLQRVRGLADRLENYYSFECEAGPLKNCVEWQRLTALLPPAAGEGERT